LKSQTSQPGSASLFTGSCQLLRRLLNSGYNVLIARASTQIATDPGANFWLAGVRAIAKKRFDRKQKSWRAEPALKTVGIPKGHLNRMENGWTGRQTFHGLEVSIIGLDRKGDARTHRLDVPQDGAGSTHTMFATDVSSCQSQIFTNKIHQ